MSAKFFISVAALAAVTGLGASIASAQISMEWSTVGNAGNAPDPTTGFGSVGYDYRIGTYEVTNGQYAAFLNAVAASDDPYGLWDDGLQFDSRGAFTRSNTNGNYTYSVKPNMGDKPVNFVDWYDAARFCNWMTNGQGSGGTESGVYTFTGVYSISGITRDLSNPNQVFLPTENEWYKAAFHQPANRGGDTDDYWLYATKSNSLPTIASATATGDVANPGQDVVNYFSGADWNGLNGYVTTVGSAGSTSFYGAFDMNGNVWEWNETLIDLFGSTWRGMRGGSYDVTNPLNLQAAHDTPINDPMDLRYTYGFRVASPVPGPGSVAFLTVVAPLLVRRRR